jgi:hypothetical protein
MQVMTVVVSSRRECEKMAKKYLILLKQPKDGGGLKDIYHNWTNAILQQLETKFWKIADALFRKKKFGTMRHYNVNNPFPTERP